MQKTSSRLAIFDNLKHFKENGLKQILLILIGALLAALGLTQFLLPLGLLDGGIVGVSLLTQRLIGHSIDIHIGIWSLPFLILGYHSIGRSFAIKSIFGVLALIIFASIIPHHSYTKDKLLAAIFGGCLLGIGSGLTMRASAVLDGTEILALYLSRKSALAIGEWVMGLNLLIFTIAGIALEWESAMYSMLAFFCSSQILEYVLHGFEEYNAITIISNNPITIRDSIVNETGRGVTIYLGKGGYTNEEKQILMCVATRLEIPAIRDLVIRVDPQAFFLTHSINEASGGMLRKIGIKH